MESVEPVMSSVNIPTIPLHVAQAMSPAPRPPSPTQRDATQRALRRENPNQLSSRDARVLMGLPQGAGGAAALPPSTESPLPTPTTAATPTQANIPGRPARDSARPDTKRRNMALENVSVHYARFHPSISISIMSRYRPRMQSSYLGSTNTFRMRRTRPPTCRIH